MREDMKLVMQMKLHKGELTQTDQIEAWDEIYDANPTVQAAIVAGVAKRAANGDVNAARLCQELLGNDEQDDAKGRDHELANLITEKFYKSIHYEILTRNSRDIWLKGGRGSTKSSWAAFEIVRDIEANPTHCSVCFRKVGNTLRDSVYSQIQFAINVMGLTEEYKASVNPMQIVKRSTGQVIIFRGCDDPKKAKGITLPNPQMFISIAWFEECDQFNGMEEIRSLRQTVSRGGDDFVRIYSYNPPRSRDSWINQEILKEEPQKFVSSSSYLDVPQEWLGQQFIDDAEALKEWDEEAYKHEYLGEPVGYGAQVFENLELREITQDEIDACSAHYNGVDWGYYPDPWVFMRIGVQTAQRTLYIYGERTGTRLSNEDSAKIIREYLESLTNAQGLKNININDEIITCDSAEPKSIEEYRRLGLHSTACTKYAGSVESGMKALAGEWKIIIDPSRCPTAAKEFNGYEFERLKDGTVVSRYPDRDNHTIDATRYAIEVLLARAPKR